jgi:iron complex outermembrane receptor protein
MSVTVAALLSLPSQNLLAQSNVSALEEVVVTARKREETIQAVPVAITAFTAESMERRGVMDFGMLSLNNPGVRIGNGTSAPGVSRIVAIRGNIQNDVTTQLDAAVGTYVDGIVVARTFVMDGALVDVESVQTLKGPQGTLFGRNTTGGAILIKTRDPELGRVFKTLCQPYQPHRLM